MRIKYLFGITIGVLSLNFLILITYYFLDIVNNSPWFVSTTFLFAVFILISYWLGLVTIHDFKKKIGGDIIDENQFLNWSNLFEIRWIVTFICQLILNLFFTPIVLSDIAKSLDVGRNFVDTLLFLPSLIFVFGGLIWKINNSDDELIKIKRRERIRREDIEYLVENVNLKDWIMADPYLQNDREFVLKAVKLDPSALEFVSDELKNDREIVLKAIEQEVRLMKFASKQLQNDREFVLKAVEVAPSVLEFVSYELKYDREFVLEAVKTNEDALEYASNSFKSDQEFVLKAVELNPGAFLYLSEELKNDREVVLLAVKSNYSRPYTFGKPALAYASWKHQNDKEIVLAAVKNPVNFMFDTTLKYASKELQNDKEIVLAAVKNTGTALEFASKELQNDKEVVSEAILSNCHSIKYASKNIQVDKLYIRTLIDEIKGKLKNLSNEQENEYFLSPLEVAHRSIEYLESEEWIE